MTPPGRTNRAADGTTRGRRIRSMRNVLLAVVGLLCACLPVAAESAVVESVASPPRDRRTTLYVSNRAPLAPSPFVKLPPGAVKPKGWLRGQLDRMRDGMTGRLSEISPWCKFEGNAWTNPKGQG